MVNITSAIFIYSVKFWKPPFLDCTECIEGVLCDDIGVKIPAVAANYWRYLPESPDFDSYPLFNCIIPNSCTGGNETIGRCAPEYDDNSPLCAVCAKEHVRQQRHQVRSTPLHVPA